MNHETGKMLMGPDHPTQIKLPKNPIDASITLKKDGVESDIKGKDKYVPRIGHIRPALNTKPVVSNFYKKSGLYSLPFDVREMIADRLYANRKEMVDWKKNAGQSKIAFDQLFHLLKEDTSPNINRKMNYESFLPGLLLPGTQKLE